MTELPDVPPDHAVAVFAGGCFWCMEGPFDELDGVKATVSGYTGGHTDDPGYEQVMAGDTGHAEAVWILYDPAVVSYGELLDVFWRQIDPTTADQQFCDIGANYRTVIFYRDESQRTEAEASRERIASDGPFDRSIVTAIEPARAFWPAEDFHQKYYRKNPGAYQAYRRGSGRDEFLEKVWGDDGNDE